MNTSTPGNAQEYVAQIVQQQQQILLQQQASCGQPPVSDEQWASAAYEILCKEGKALHVNDIARKIVETGLIKGGARTVLDQILLKEINLGSTRFKKLENNFFTTVDTISKTSQQPPPASHATLPRHQLVSKPQTPAVSLSSHTIVMTRPQMLSSAGQLSASSRAHPQMTSVQKPITVGQHLAAAKQAAEGQMRLARQQAERLPMAPQQTGQLANMVQVGRFPVAPGQGMQAHQVVGLPRFPGPGQKPVQQQQQQQQQVSMLQRMTEVPQLSTPPHPGSTETKPMPHVLGDAATLQLRGVLQPQQVRGTVPSQLTRGTVPLQLTRAQLTRGTVPVQLTRGAVPLQFARGTVPTQLIRGPVLTQPVSGGVPSEQAMEGVPAHQVMGAVPAQQNMNAVPAQQVMVSVPSQQAVHSRAPPPYSTVNQPSAPQPGVTSLPLNQPVKIEPTVPQLKTAVNGSMAHYRMKYKRLKKVAKYMLFTNAALCDETAQTQEKLLRAKEERRFLLKKLFQHQSLSDAASIAAKQHVRLLQQPSQTKPVRGDTPDETSIGEKSKKKSGKKRVGKDISDEVKMKIKKTSLSSMPGRKLVQPLPLDSAGRPVFPVVLGELTIYSVGEIVSDLPGFHTSDLIFPEGYCSTRVYVSVRNPEQKCLYTCKITGDGSEPVFEISPEDEPNLVFSGSTASECHNELLKSINKNWGSEVLNTMGDRGAAFFGVSHPAVQNLIQSCPGARKCSSYKWIKFEVCRSVEDEMNLLEPDNNMTVSYEHLQRSSTYLRACSSVSQKSMVSSQDTSLRSLLSRKPKTISTELN